MEKWAKSVSLRKMYRMKKTIWLALAASILSFASCLDDPEDIRWQEDNEAFMNSLKDSTDIFPLEINDKSLTEEKGGVYEPTGATGIYYKIISSGTGQVPCLGQTVSVNYSGWLYDGTPFDEGYLTFELGKTTIEGFTEVVQRMHQGDIWKVYIPYYLGYGEMDYGYSSPFIPGYSALVFLVELKSVD